MDHPGETLHGWSLGYTRGRCGPLCAVLKTELGRFTAVWYDGVENAASVVFNAYYRSSISNTPHTAPAKQVGWFPVDEIVGQCLLFDTTC